MSEKAIEVTYFLLRVVAGFLFFQAGALILFGWFGGVPAPDPSAPPTPAWMETQMKIGGVLEFAGGVMLMLGLLTRPVAFLLSGMMAVAYWQFHYAAQGGWPLQNGGIPAVIFCFLYLYMSARGAGEWSVDAAIRRARTKGARS